MKSIVVLAMIFFSLLSFGQTEGEGVYESPGLVVTGIDFEDLTGCWAKIYDGPDFNGRSITVVGYTNWANLSTTGWPEWSGQIDSVEVGPDATLVLYGLPFFADEDHTIVGGVSVRNVSQVPAGDSLESLRLSCSP